MIRVHGLSYSVETDRGERGILDDVNFEAEGPLAIIGPNGSGKSTLSRLMARQVSPASGEISLEWSHDGVVSSVLPQVAHIPQVSTSGLWSDLTVRETLVLAVGRGRVLWGGYRSWKECKKGIDWLPKVLEDRLEAHVSDLSSGERQMLLLAASLAGHQQADPRDLWLCVDEFAAALDPRHAALAREALESVLRSVLGGERLILVTHSFAEVVGFARSVVALREGKVSWSGEARGMSIERFHELYDPPGKVGSSLLGHG